MVIIFEIEQESIALCTRLLPCKSDSDEFYSIPIKKYEENLWAVQILDKDLAHLTSDEFSSRVDLPSDWFQEIF